MCFKSKFKSKQHPSLSWGLLYSELVVPEEWESPHCLFSKCAFLLRKSEQLNLRPRGVTTCQPLGQLSSPSIADIFVHIWDVRWPDICRVLPLTTWAGWVTVMEPARKKCVSVKAHAHSRIGIQGVQVPTSFPPLPSHVQHLIAHEAQADPLFYLFLKKSCTQERMLTSSILQMKRLRHRKEKSSSGAWTKLTLPDDSVLHHSLLYPCSWSNTPPTWPSYCTGPSGTAYSDRSRWVSGQSILWGPRGSSLHGELHSQ